MKTGIIDLKEMEMHRSFLAKDQLESCMSIEGSKVERRFVGYASDGVHD